MVNRVVTTVVGGALKVLGSTLKGAGSLVTRASGSSKSSRPTKNDTTPDRQP